MERYLRRGIPIKYSAQTKGRSRNNFPIYGVALYGARCTRLQKNRGTI